MPQKVLKCVIQLEIHAVTCPGVMLPRKDEVYINICMLGQYWKTKCFMPVFPLLIHESLQFEKVFGRDVVDPADVAAFLECDTTKFELMQYSPSVDEILANYEDNTRNFLFPEPKLTPSYPGVDREALMKRCSPAFLIAPKLEFSTTTTITECCPRSPKKVSSSLCLSESGRKENQFRRPRCAKSFNLIGKSCSEKKSVKEHKKPATAVRSRSLSPYCRKCLLELCSDDGQHSSPCKSDSISRTSFTNHSRDRNQCEKKHSSSLSCSSFNRSAKPRPRTASPSIYHNDSCRSRYNIGKSFDVREPVSWDELSSEAEELISYPLKATTRDNPNDPYSSSVCSRRKPPCNPNRLYFDPVSHPAWDRIHERVQNLLASIDAQERASARNISFTCPPCS
ncbi:spermatogenesis associated 6-like protein isoform X1 [Chiloscyllium plagiosum]|uniref:spermatogenesis associated 6-like protein isoform X1 n=1 Tax=Chiloscyllium plagiosum TaxID=36176 RepID=UPI001CB7DDF5|nr:spermatogenesis associated 6-like protein isoform X1 [Chiloscyllium plagiosum]XP_043574696.1 spermatogenesis associated 6-like protein isoform X1 [Chiloscyllium plagiosum]XP_043574707.1 spermatogenesis associated 6-like protein isoform X1 [Chiloscyllium plagiosum]